MSKLNISVWTNNFDELTRRSRKFTETYNMTFNTALKSPQIHKLVVKGQAVIFCNTRLRRELFIGNPHLVNKVAVAKHKYLYLTWAYVMNKKHFLYKEILSV